MKCRMSVQRKCKEVVVVLPSALCVTTASTNMMRVVRVRTRWAGLLVKLCHARATRSINRAREHGVISSPLASSSLHLEQRRRNDTR